MINPILQMGKMRLEGLSDLRRATQIINGGDRIHTQVFVSMALPCLALKGWTTEFVSNGATCTWARYKGSDGERKKSVEEEGEGRKRGSVIQNDLNKKDQVGELTTGLS